MRHHIHPIERRVFAPEVRLEPGTTRAGVDGPGRLSGHAAVFNRLSVNLGGFKERIAPGAFRRAIGRDDVRALFNHDPSLVLGRTRSRTLKLWEDAQGLAFEVVLPDTTTGRDVAELVRRGDVSQGSFGFSVPPDGESWSVDADGQRIRTVTEVRLYDVAVAVTFPAYLDTDVSLVERTTGDRARSGGLPFDVDGDLDRRRRRLRLAEIS